MKNTSLVLALIASVLLSSTSAWAQAPLPKVRLEGLPMLSLAAANLPSQTGARDDLPATSRLQRGRRWTAVGAGLLAASVITFATFGRKNFCSDYDTAPQFLSSPFIVGSALAAAGLTFTIAGTHRIHSSETRGGSAWKRWVAPLLLGAGVSAVTAGAAAVGPVMQGMRAGCFSS